MIFNNGEYNDLEQNIIKNLKEKNIPFYQNIKDLNINKSKLYFLNDKVYDNENDNSVVIFGNINNYQFLLMGDASISVEDNLLNNYNLNNIDVLKVGHHGSKSSTSKGFINQILPKYSIISVGENNRYNLPDISVLNNLENSQIYRTDLNGTITIKINNQLKIIPFINKVLF